jgi:CheY-like chemotaxis protein
MGAGELLIRVTDSGIGIMRQQMATLFQPFAQADATRSRRYGGSGLGLYISRALIERMGGSIHVSSEMGCGSCFSVRLPIDERGHAAPDEPAASTILPPRRQSFAGVRVLVAEDDDILQELMRAMLGELGVIADVVSNGRQAIEHMQAASYDLVLMDMHMPELDGREATRRLRAAGIAIPIVALTADLVPESIDEHRAAGCDCVLAKPLTRDQLASTLEQCLAGSAGAFSRERG